MTSVDTEMRELSHFIGGEWVSAGGTFEDTDPFTGETVARVAAGTRARRPRGRCGGRGGGARLGGDRRPRSASGSSSRRPTSSRRAATRSSRGSHARPGCTFGFGMFQMGFVPGLFRQAAALAYAPLGQVIPSDHPGTLAMGIRRPVGVVGAIAPWNAALILSARSIAAPLALGNTVVLKPSEWSPYVGRPPLGRDLRRGGAARRAC